MRIYTAARYVRCAPVYVFVAVLSLILVAADAAYTAGPYDGITGIDNLPPDRPLKYAGIDFDTRVESNAIGSISSATSFDPADLNWAGDFAFPGVGHQIFAAVIYNGDLVIAGSFEYIGDLSVHHLARWDGSQWHAMLNELSNGYASAYIWDLSVHDGELIIGGDFTSVNGMSANRVAAWDGTTWRSLDSGLDFRVMTLAEYNGRLYAGGIWYSGSDTRLPLARWVGGHWVHISPATTSNPDPFYCVYALEEFDGRLWVGGRYESPLGNVLVTWNDTSWSSVSGSPVDGGVYTLGTFDSQLLVGGYYHIPGSADYKRLLTYDGAGWDSLGQQPNGEVSAFASYAGDLVIGGGFLQVDGIPAKRLAVWDGASWSQLGPGLDGTQIADLVVRDGALIPAGVFQDAGGVHDYVAAWDGAAFNRITPSVGEGLDGAVEAMIEYGGNLLVGGDYIGVAGSNRVDNAALWDGTGWTALGDGPNGWVLSLAEYNNEVYAGGGFFWVNGITGMQAIARWDGIEWTDVGGGLDWSAYVRAMTVYDGKLIAAGSFVAENNGDPLTNVAAWDGSAWTSLGSGLSGGAVLDVEVWNGDLYVGGTFESAGGVSTGAIARWDGSSWSAVGGGTNLNTSVTELGVYDGKLIISGGFTTLGGQPWEGQIAAWDGSSWSHLGGGLNGNATAMAATGNVLIVGGSFTEAGGLNARHIAVWNGSCWGKLGSGTGGTVHSLAVWNGSVFAGGDLQSAGGKASSYIARWDGVVPECVCCLGNRGNVDNDPQDLVVISDLTYLVGFLFNGGTPPACMTESDIDGSGGTSEPNVSDVTYLVAYLFQGGPPPTPCP